MLFAVTWPVTGCCLLQLSLEGINCNARLYMLLMLSRNHAIRAGIYTPRLEWSIHAATCWGGRDRECFRRGAPSYVFFSPLRGVCVSISLFQTPMGLFCLGFSFLSGKVRSCLNGRLFSIGFFWKLEAAPTTLFRIYPRSWVEFTCVLSFNKTRNPRGVSNEFP